MTIPMFWFYLPLAITLVLSGICFAISTSNDRSGSGMVLLFLIPFTVAVSVVAWLLYFAAGMFFGIR